MTTPRSIWKYEYLGPRMDTVGRSGMSFDSEADAIATGKNLWHQYFLRAVEFREVIQPEPQLSPEAEAVLACNDPAQNPTIL